MICWCGKGINKAALHLKNKIKIMAKNTMGTKLPRKLEQKMSRNNLSFMSFCLKGHDFVLIILKI